MCGLFVSSLPYSPTWQTKREKEIVREERKRKEDRKREKEGKMDLNRGTPSILDLEPFIHSSEIGEDSLYLLHFKFC